MAVRILAGLVDVEGVMGVLERRHRESPRDEAGDHPGEERGLAGTAPAGEADDAHGDMIAKPSAREDAKLGPGTGWQARSGAQMSPCCAARRSAWAASSGVLTLKNGST